MAKMENDRKKRKTCSFCADHVEYIDYKDAIATLHKAIEMLGDDSVSASAKNKLLLTVVDKIVYHRPKAIRMTVDEAREKGVKIWGGWYCPDFELDIHLKI